MQSVSIDVAVDLRIRGRLEWHESSQALLEERAGCRAIDGGQLPVHADCIMCNMLRCLCAPCGTKTDKAAILAQCRQNVDAVEVCCLVMEMSS